MPQNKAISRVCHVAFWALFLLFLAPISGSAQDENTPPAVPAPAVEKAEALPQVPFKGPVVVELFSSQACVFCPKADALFADLVQLDGVIGLACHVPYNDVSRDSIAKDFCAARQTYYQSILRAGPNYTPQMVVNGSRDVVGHRMNEVTATIREAAAAPVLKLDIAESKGPRNFETALPKLENPSGPYDLWLAVIDKPHKLLISEGNNKGMQGNYRNIVSYLENIGTWDGGGETLRFDLAFTVENAGVILLAQERRTGEIVAAGKFMMAAKGS